MEQLLIESNEKTERISLKFSRYLLDELDLNERLTALKGARGVGKTTLLLQYMAQHHRKSDDALYVSMDHQYFYDNRLIDLADRFQKTGGRFLFLDEVHKYPNWSREMKLIYDNYPDLKVVFTSSSILNIYSGESDLSRRVISFNLNNLSLREFIELNSGIKLQKVSFDDILKNHKDIAFEFLKQIKPIAHMNNYIRYGAYPFFKEGRKFYFQKLNNIINLIIDVDINIIYNPDYQLIYKAKKLLHTIAVSSPFIPNISKLSERIGVSRPTLIKALNYLDQALLIIQASKPQKGIGVLSKPDKIYLHNPNLLFALAEENANTGNIRETFFINQIKNMGMKINVSGTSDFLVNDKYTFEVGGKNKGQNQIRKTSNAFVIRDDIETGTGNIIPLWLFGMMY